MGVVGKSIPRLEDPALVTGKAKYTDDLKLPGMAHAVILRSPHAHARIRRIDFTRARKAPGVIAVYGAKEVEASDAPGMLPVGWLLPDIKTPGHPILAGETVRYVGDGVAVVVAEERELARDAIELIEVEYEPLEATVDPELATKDGAPQLFDDVPNNVSFDWSVGDREKTDAAFASAARTVSLRLRNNRMISHPIEPRAALASFDPADDLLTLWMTSQNPHVHRLLMCIASLGLPEHKIRVVVPEMGGGFGAKIPHYADEAIAAWCSMQLERPVKWTATRSEGHITDSHGRDHVSDAELALDANGKIVGLRATTWAALGGYLSTFAPGVPTYMYGTLLSGVYEIPAIHARVIGAFTNTVPVDASRGAGRPEATYLVERMAELAAIECGIDPAEFRRRNFIPADAFPYETPLGFVYDSGNYEAALDKALAMVDYAAVRERQAAARRDGGALVGIGCSTYVEASGLAPSRMAGKMGVQAGLWESARVRVHPTGSVTVFSGCLSHGQGHVTTYSQIVADRLGIDIGQIRVVQGDTAEVQFGMGTYGSRSAAVGGSAIATAADKVIAKAKRIAAHLLAAAPEAIVFADGLFSVEGDPDRSKAWGEVVLMAYLAHDLPDDVEPGLEETSFYNPSNYTFPFGAHIAVVEIDRDTGEVEIVRYCAVDDCGKVIHPTVVEGQIHGGVVHGIGQALFEQAIYDASGQLITGTMMDYAIPRAHRLPHIETARTVTPCPHNPLGVKGVGEAGTIAAPAAIVNAVLDALAPLGVRHLDMPLTPPKVWRAIRDAEGGAQ